MQQDYLTKYELNYFKIITIRKIIFDNFKIEPPNYELMPSEDLRQTLSLIKDIFDSYNNSVVSIDTKKKTTFRLL